MYIIKEIIDFYNIISENKFYDEKEEDILFKKILNHISENKIKYAPKEKKLIKINSHYYMIIITLFKCMIDKKSIEKDSLKDDDYYLYFKSFERCSKEKINKLLRWDIKELNVLNDFIIIYNVFEKAGKLKKWNKKRKVSNIKLYREKTPRNK